MGCGKLNTIDEALADKQIAHLQSIVTVDMGAHTVLNPCISSFCQYCLVTAYNTWHRLGKLVPGYAPQTLLKVSLRPPYWVLGEARMGGIKD